MRLLLTHRSPAAPVAGASPVVHGLALARMLFSAVGCVFSADKGVMASLEQKLREIDEECRVEESRRVDLELSIMEVKDNLKKAEAGPVTLGTTVDTTHLESVSPRVSARPAAACRASGTREEVLCPPACLSPYCLPLTTAQSCRHSHPCT